jgi:hypothetical protein
MRFSYARLRMRFFGEREEVELITNSLYPGT